MTSKMAARVLSCELGSSSSGDQRKAVLFLAGTNGE